MKTDGGQSCKAFIGLSVGAKIIGGGRPLLPEILSQSDCIVAKSHITSFSLARRRYYRLPLLPIMLQCPKYMYIRLFRILTSDGKNRPGKSIRINLTSESNTGIFDSVVIEYITGK